jgi:hypothetical protein
MTYVITTRRTVDTVEQARTVAAKIARDSGSWSHALDNARAIGAVRQALALPATGGAIGPLPDGTIIQVEEGGDMSPIEELQAKYDRKVAHIARTVRYYDEAPDGSRQKQEAEATLRRLDAEKAEVERQIDEALA